MKYPVAVWITDSLYSAEVPNLPGVITEADSIAEQELSIKEAVSVREQLKNQWFHRVSGQLIGFPRLFQLANYPFEFVSISDHCHE